MSEQVSDQPQAPSDRRRILFLGLGGAALAVAFCCLVAVALFVVLDPFGWVAQWLGGGAGAATVTPADAVVYVSLDLARLRSEEVDGLIATFAEAADSDVRDLEAAIEDLDKRLDEEFGMTLTQDVLPWVGQSAGLSLLDVQLGDYGDVEEIQALLALESRDRQGADAFIERFKQAVKEDQGGSFEESQYEGITVYTLGDSVVEWAIARSRSYVLIGSTTEVVQAAVDAQRGDSLADLQAYRETVALLPSGRICTVYLNMERYFEVLQEAMAGMGAGAQFAGFQVSGAGDAAMAISVVEEGVRIDSASVFDLDTITEAQRQAYAAVSPLTIDAHFPEDTLLFAAGQRLDLSWAALEASAAENEAWADWQESLDLLEDEIGIDLSSDLIAYLDGQLAFGMAPSSTGMLPDQVGVPLGFLLLADTSHEEALRETVQALTDRMAEEGQTAIEETTIGGLQAYEVIDPYLETTVMVYGVDEATLFLSTGRDLIETAFGEGPSLADNEQYQATWRAFPEDAIPLYYLDLAGLLGQIREGQAGLPLEDFEEATAFLRPIRVIASATSPLRGDRSQASIIVFIDWAEPAP